jgi:hypothetical protein
LIFLASSSGILAQEARVIVLTDGPIPEDGFETWSVFLICSPTWLRPDHKQELLSLYEDFWAFGNFIGDKHLAIWFVKSAQTSPHGLANSLDLERNAQFCTKFGLKPSETPHVLVTDSYQVLVNAVEEIDRPAELEDVARVDVVKFNGLPPSQVAGALDLLVNKVLEKRSNETAPDSRSSWQIFKAIVETTSDVILKLSDEISVTFDMKIFKVTIN